jgi:hypothetical protein
MQRNYQVAQMSSHPSRLEAVQNLRQMTRNSNHVSHSNLVPQNKHFLPDIYRNQELTDSFELAEEDMRKVPMFHDRSRSVISGAQSNLIMQSPYPLETEAGIINVGVKGQLKQLSVHHRRSPSPPLSPKQAQKFMN